MNWINFFINLFSRHLHPTPTPAPAPSPAADVPQQFLALLNNARKQRGLKPLTLDAMLNTSAQNFANDAAAHHLQGHVGSDGTSPWDRIKAAGYNYSTCGECLAIDPSGVQASFSLLMNDIPHYLIMMSKEYINVGVGHSGDYYVLDFGSPV